MTQISKRTLSKTIEEKIYNTLWEVFSQLKSIDEIQFFTEDLFSPVEKVMIAKRLAIAALLTRGYSYESIREMLKVSTSTIAKVAVVLNTKNGYKIAINKASKSERMSEFWKDIERLGYRFGSRSRVFIPATIVQKKFPKREKTLLR